MMRRLNLAVLGTRGFPGVQGGVESHCLELYPRLAAQGVAVTVYGRKGYIGHEPYIYKGVRVVPSWTWKQKHVEAIVHTFLGLLNIRRTSPRADLVHIHGIGPGLITPLARGLGFRVVVTHHGPDYVRQKWGRSAKLVLRLGEILAARFAHQVISVSRTIQEHLQKRCGRDSVYIPNGVNLPLMQPPGAMLSRHGLEPRQYILAVGRVVPEKGFHDLLQAFQGLPGDIKLVIVGDADHEDDYSRSLKTQAAGDARVVLTGFITGQDLAEIYANARFFVLPSYHEGLPLVLLEALSYGLRPLVSAIPANLEVIDNPALTFPPGDIRALQGQLSAWINQPWDLEWSEMSRARLQKEYNWDQVALATLAVYQKVKPS